MSGLASTCTGLSSVPKLLSQRTIRYGYASDRLRAPIPVVTLPPIATTLTVSPAAVSALHVRLRASQAWPVTSSCKCSLAATEPDLALRGAAQCFTPGMRPTQGWTISVSLSFNSDMERHDSCRDLMISQEAVAQCFQQKAPCISFLNTRCNPAGCPQCRVDCFSISGELAIACCNPRSTTSRT